MALEFANKYQIPPISSDKLLDSVQKTIVAEGESAQDLFNSQLDAIVVGHQKGDSEAFLIEVDTSLKP